MSDMPLAGRCPVDHALDFVGAKWKPRIIWRLSAGPMRFGEMRRAMPDVTQRMLTLHLRELERDGLITRTVLPGVPPGTEYALTEVARRVVPALHALGAWAAENRAELGLDDAGAGGQNASAIPKSATVSRA